MRCAENRTSLRIYATGWIPVKETRRSYWGNTSVNREQSTSKCLQLITYSTKTGLRLHTQGTLLRFPVAISLLCIPTIQSFSYIPRLYSTELQRHPIDFLNADEIFQISFLLLQQCPGHKVYVRTLPIILPFLSQPVMYFQRYHTK